MEEQSFSFARCSYHHGRQGQKGDRKIIVDGSPQTTDHCHCYGHYEDSDISGISNSTLLFPGPVFSAEIAAAKARHAIEGKNNVLHRDFMNNVNYESCWFVEQCCVSIS